MREFLRGRDWSITVGNPVLGVHSAPKFKGQGSLRVACPFKQTNYVSTVIHNVEKHSYAV